MARTAEAYTRGRVNKVLLCKLLPGREYKIGGTSPTPGAPAGNTGAPPSRQPMLGAPLKDGYDSHVVNDGEEVVIYQSAQILPAYVIHWT